MARFAAIDLGSNALRLRIVEAQGPLGSNEQLSFLPDGGMREVLSLRAPVRLGAEVFVTGKLAAASIGQACAALKDFRQAMDAAKVDSYRATATSAVREAENSAVLVERARREAGIELEVIEGVEEARLIRVAVSKRLGLDDRRALLVDLGGGSTEVSLLVKGETVFSMSLPLGTVRLIEIYLRGGAAVDGARTRLLAEGIDRALAEVRPHLANERIDVMVGTGGNVDALVDLCRAPGAEGVEPKLRTVDVGALKKLKDELTGLSVAERRAKYNLRPDRADTILPATYIFHRVAELFRQKTIVAPGVGLKEGILEELIAKHFDAWDRESEARSVLAACVRLGQRYHFDEAHGHRVTEFACELFDALLPEHGLGLRERLLLRAAATLHDVGDFVRYDGHHKHSFYLIQHSDIMGLSTEDRAIVANVARYHRKSPPDPSHPNFRDLDKVARGKVRVLAAILRIADALDREHLGKVRGVRAEVDRAKRKLVLYLSGEEDRSLEEWTVRAKSELLRDALDLEVVVEGAKVRSIPPEVAKASKAK